ncbi:MAG: hypothetical protein AB8C84_09655 [Oligoflexales bacterium]
MLQSITVTLLLTCMLLSAYGCDNKPQENQAAEAPEELRHTSEKEPYPQQADAVSEKQTEGLEVGAAGQKEILDVGKDEEQVEVTPSHYPCEVSVGLPTELSKMEDVVEFINLLPKPLSLPCLIQHLPRPLPLYATLSTLSVQPAFDDQTPRIFLLYGDLILSFVALGEESDFLEMSHILNTVSSVKGEIQFPVMQKLEPADPYKKIASKDVEGSRCQGCHTDEKAAPPPFPMGSLQSSAIRPMPQMEMSLQFLEYYADQCEDLSLIRCQMLKSLFDGEVESHDFPKSMKTFF